VRDALSVTIAGPYEGDETITCVIPGHGQPGEEVVAEELSATAGAIRFTYQGVCGFAASFDYAGEALPNP
jgi:hypothetical protein